MDEAEVRLLPAAAPDWVLHLQARRFDAPVLQRGYAAWRTREAIRRLPAPQPLWPRMETE